MLTLVKRIIPLILLAISTMVHCYSSCHTPIGEKGRCVPSEQCQFMLDLQRIYRNKLPPAIQNQIEQMTCSDGSGSTFRLCCPIKSLISDKPDKLMTKSAKIEQPKLQDLSHMDPSGLELLNSVTTCGAFKLAKTVSGGQPTSDGEFPWLVALKYETSGRPFLCGGSLITDRFVLTAAHCTTSAAKLIGVLMGKNSLDNQMKCLDTFGRMDCKSNYREYAIEDIRTHPLYKKTAISYDIALIKLVQTVEFQDNIQPICLPIEKNFQDIPFNQKFYISGWGKTEYNEPSTILLKAMVERQDLDVCRNYFLDAPLTENHICAVGDGKQHTCQGDSGGPLFFSRLSKVLKGIHYVQFGIISTGGLHCGANDNQPGIFASVVDMLPWITQNLF